MYIFFIRRFPDVDHMFPIIYKMAQKRRGCIGILCQNLDFNIHEQFILNFLRQEFEIRSEYSYNIDGSVLRRLCSKVLFSARRIYPKIGIRLVASLHRLLYGEKWAEKLLVAVDASALILDFDRVSKYSTKVIVQAAKSKNIPVVLVTHGTAMGISNLVKKDKTYWPSTDFKIAPNLSALDFYRTESDGEQTFKIFGSPRYCDEWERFYNRLLEKEVPCLDLPDKNEKLKVLFFERPKIRFNSNHDSVRLVTKMSFVTAIFSERLEKKNAYYKIAGSKYPSARLIQWADVVVMSISSIALEVLWQNKILIYLKYLAPDDVCVFDQYGACWSVNSQNELIEALRTIYDNPGYRPYSQENVEKLFRDVVYAGDRSRDVLNDHVDFLFSLTDRAG